MNEYISITDSQARSLRKSLGAKKVKYAYMTVVLDGYEVIRVRVPNRPG